MSAVDRTEVPQSAEERFDTSRYQVVASPGSLFFPTGDHYTICERHAPDDGFTPRSPRPTRRHKILRFLNH